MQLITAAIPLTRRFCASKADLKQALGNIEPLSVHMGSLGTKFTFDPRCHHRPRLEGHVVASVGVSRDLTAIFQVYAIPVDDYPAEAVEQFRTDVLPRMRSWLVSQLAKPQTAILGYEQLIVEWTGSQHRDHVVRFL
jgi:hypothetical protein